MKRQLAVSRFVRTRRTLALVVIIIACGATVAGAAAVTLATGVLATSSKTLTHATCTLAADSADTYVDQKSPTTFNDTSTTISTLSKTSQAQRIYLEFNLGSCATPIPSGAEVDSATLTLTTTIAPAAARTLSVRRVTSSWTASATSWNVQPTFASTVTSTLSVSAVAGADNFDVTNDVNDFVQSAPTPTPPPYSSAAINYGWVIADEGASSTTSDTFASNEFATAASRPKLVITYGS
jgi:hypothetical protein